MLLRGRVSNPFRGNRAAQREKDDFSSNDGYSVSNPFRGNRAAQREKPGETRRRMAAFQTPFGEIGLRNMTEESLIEEIRQVSNPFRGNRAAQPVDQRNKGVP